MSGYPPSQSAADGWATSSEQTFDRVQLTRSVTQRSKSDCQCRYVVRPQIDDRHRDGGSSPPQDATDRDQTVLGQARNLDAGELSTARASSPSPLESCAP